ncbi:MAG: type II toxin-antitoxin system RelE/ParE family toxin [Roseburia sp.]|nr:type II toxin-antitoxin system RelE/ParE family toxin [Roseburia sp.]MCM1243131.1 type II toxin-antitoxin system RelE/ParE family toxin [Roseburia sp.]
MAWNIRITDEAKKDYNKIEGSIRKQVLAGIIKVSKAPLPSPNGYGKPLGNKNGNNLTGFFKIKYRGIGIRVVYTLVINKMLMNIIVISQRDDDQCYDLAARLYDKYGDDVFKDIFGEFPKEN